MYVYPDGLLYVLSGVPLDPTYDHTIYFGTESAQETYFRTKTKYSFTKQNYQRADKGYIRIEKCAEDLYCCNYIMFQNLAFSSTDTPSPKWFYAFINSIEYVNNHVSLIHFEIDDMQTWFFDYTLDNCWVEREHSATDHLFENYVEENLDIGDEYVGNAQPSSCDLSSMALCALITRNTVSQGQATGRLINNIYTPITVSAGIPVNASGVQAMDAFLNGFQEDEIIAVYQYPAALGDASSATPTVLSQQVNMPSTVDGYTIDGYVPKNKKLLGYPYNVLLVSNNCGETALYRWEDFGTLPATFRIVGVFATTPAVICYPFGHRRITNDYDSGLVLANFPQCAWSGDTFKAWWAQNKASFVTSGITSVLSSVGGLATVGIATAVGAASAPALTAGMVGSALISSGSIVAQQIAKKTDIKHTPSQTHGQTQTDSLNAGMGRVGFTFYPLSIKRQYAEIIDDYFTRFGYACKRNKEPNRNVRPHWTYTKTTGCTISAATGKGLPADAATHICDIYNNGITFWRNGNEVGNYTLDNSPST